LPSSAVNSSSGLAASVRASASTWASTPSTSELRRNAAVPTPAAMRPTARSATVTPVTFARRLVPRHHRVIASGFCVRSSPSLEPRYAVLPAFSM
jgi:hypothetical protein